MNNSVENRALALAGVLQAAWLAQQAARRGLCSGCDIEHSLRSIFITDPQDISEVFGGTIGVRKGLELLEQQLSGDHGARDLEVIRYTLNLLHLEKRLARQPDMQNRIREEILSIVRQTASAIQNPTQAIGRLADIYIGTLSTFTPRMLINGDPEHLANQDTTQLIRALLLAGVRAAVLWRQAGGNRWRLLVERGKLLRVARQLRDRSDAA